ncbi:MAG TPA: glycerate kinase [Novimethylophilus sp.]|jgi:hydroxypyruvate reductase|uniref:glycerate kinase type-2 family protein n=1 Tax=Novimethylophilus sp. TaxID=2137426 RepID=UPI002F41D2A0
MSQRHLNLLREMFDAAIEAAQPALCVPPHLPPPPSGRTIVIGAGKAAAAMARAVETNWSGALSGLVLTRQGYTLPCERIEIVAASHPIPDAIGMRTAERMLDMVRGLTENDLVICLFSGGGSALMPLPISGITLRDKQQISRALLRSGAAIREINCVRRHLSSIKGGRLAAACVPAKVVTLLISDVPGDNPVDIASGPTVADSTTCADALEVLRRYGVAVPPHVLGVLESGSGETLKPADARLARCTTHIVAAARTALEAAARVAQSAGVTPLILGGNIEGEARDVGRVMGGIALRAAMCKGPVESPCVLISGGETTVTVRGGGCGGRNVEFLLALAIALDGFPGIYGLAGDTDGVDGQAEIAGAVIAPDTLRRALQQGIDIRESLADNDGHGFFRALGDSLITGPTYTNVNDFRAILIAGI